ncbi:DUF2793 domain-containing protein [Rhizobium sullae]|uniref:DUF2793 domain-containing protein n=1 Tax=Rhizobium sullae TaxID=50338 RepID=A0ABY5XFU4_RHISU|nr:DUF2793 domain-containing protein [Rhizobium sullae]UWU13074.1 DUF2793 domain-containing protein [Rhizobium sullae]
MTAESALRLLSECIGRRRSLDRQSGVWLYIAPREGWRAFFLEAGKFRILQAGLWSDLSPPAPSSLPLLGLNATADTTNRLAVAGPASLFSQEGQGHQIKVNKASAGDTASLLAFGRAQHASGDWLSILRTGTAHTSSVPGRPK